MSVSGMLTMRFALGMWMWILAGCGIAAPFAVATSATGHPSSPAPESSITLQQIVARQEEHYRKFKTAQGTVVWQERNREKPEAASQVPADRVIHFAFGQDRAVNLVLPFSEEKNYTARHGKIDWSKVLSAALITSETVQVITTTSGTIPEVHYMPFNPAVHENNPVIAFHPRQVGEERVPLRELAKAVPQMAAKPRVLDVTVQGRPMLRVEFANPNAPGESIYYLVDPNKAYLATEIGRLSGGRVSSRSTILIGSTADGLWLPARRTTRKYAGDGSVVAEENWYYEYLSVNEKLAPQLLTLLFFALPEGTKIYPLPETNSMAEGSGKAGKATPVATQGGATRGAAAPVVGSGSGATPQHGARRYY